MSIDSIPLFSEPSPPVLGAGFHNIGSGVLRASDERTVSKIEQHYGERCGHIPLAAQQARLLVEQPTSAIEHQVRYLSRLFHKELLAVNFADFVATARRLQTTPLVVPYINVPETEQIIEQQLHARAWGLPGKMVHVLKNKASFYELVDRFQLPGFETPDYRICDITLLTETAQQLLRETEELYAQADLSGSYPLGVVIRASESDGNYGNALISEQHGRIVVIRDGDAEHPDTYTDWTTALTSAQQQLTGSMNLQKERRIVISRYLDFVDSPGLSVVLLHGESASLGWNGQLQMEGSKACVGTSSYVPKTTYLHDMQERFEPSTASFLTTLLQKTAELCTVDFTQIEGIANIDIMLPGPLEQRLRKYRKQANDGLYVAECNPRWTNYTDAILAVLGASRRTPTVQNMRAVIREGIFTIDKHRLPQQIDPRIVRDHLGKQEDQLLRRGLRIIARMTKNPMGLILVGDAEEAQREMETVIHELASA